MLRGHEDIPKQLGAPEGLTNRTMARNGKKNRVGCPECFEILTLDSGCVPINGKPAFWTIYLSLQTENGHGHKKLSLYARLQNWVRNLE